MFEPHGVQLLPWPTQSPDLDIIELFFFSFCRSPTSFLTWDQGFRNWACYVTIQPSPTTMIQSWKQKAGCEYCATCSIKLKIWFSICRSCYRNSYCLTTCTNFCMFTRYLLRERSFSIMYGSKVLILGETGDYFLHQESSRISYKITHPYSVCNSHNINDVWVVYKPGYDCI